MKFLVYVLIFILWTEITLSTPIYHLGIKKFSTGKLCFTLNSEKIFPVIKNFTIYEVTKENINKCRNDKFNLIYLKIDYSDVINSDRLIRAIELCKEQKIPIIVELNEYDLWIIWLRENESCNMQLYDGKYVHYYPDFVNPETRKEHLRRLEIMTKFFEKYYYNPVIAFSLGAYDAYHIPDGETHLLFKCPLPSPNEQWLPFGICVLNDYKTYLKNNKITATDIGFKLESEIYLPVSFKKAKNELHWYSWIKYRRYYCKKYIKDTAKLVHQISGLPVTMTYDVNFGIVENWATPVYDIDDGVDFVIVYYYGIEDPALGRIEQLLEYLSLHYKLSNKPMISLLEFSSALGTGISAKDYLYHSLPYVSGFMFGTFDIRGNTQIRYIDFVTTIKEIDQKKLFSLNQKDAKLAVILSSEDIYVQESVTHQLFLSGIAYDIIYDIDLKQKLIKNYKILYIPSGQPMLYKNSYIKKVLDKFSKNGNLVIDESQGQFLIDRIESVVR